MKGIIWFTLNSISYTKGMGIKYFIKRFISAYIKWNRLMKSNLKISIKTGK